MYNIRVKIGEGKTFSAEPRPGGYRAKAEAQANPLTPEAFLLTFSTVVSP
jgi:hypothetical protein